MSHELYQYVMESQRTMAAHYRRIRQRASEDPGTAGDDGEETWATLFRDWLPAGYKVVTKGRILTETGWASRQFDVIVLAPWYPNVLEPMKTFLSAGVVAAFECKITLKAAHVTEAIDKCAELVRHLPKTKGTPRRELVAPIYFGLLSHSHSWTRRKSKPIENIEAKLSEADREHVQHPREMLNVITIADLTTWYTTRWIEWNLKEKDVIADTTTAYMRYFADDDRPAFTPIGALLLLLYERLAWERSEMRQWYHYVASMRELNPSAEGRPRQWPQSVFTKQLLAEAASGQIRIDSSFDEWNDCFEC